MLFKGFSGIAAQLRGNALVYSIQKRRKHHRGICGVFYVDKCLCLRYNTPKKSERKPKEVPRMKTRNELNLHAVRPVERIRGLLDAAHVVGFVCLLPVRISMSRA